jgi:hypothetical protein
MPAPTGWQRPECNGNRAPQASDATPHDGLKRRLANAYDRATLPARRRLRCGLTTMPPRAILLALLLAAGTAGAADQGVTISPTDLRERPFLDAAKLERLPGKTQLEVLARQAGWLQVRVGERSGWVRMLSVRLGAPTAETTSGGWMARLGIGPGRIRAASQGGPTVTTGIRGLSVVELENARPDLEQVKRMRESMATPARAKAHAVQVGLAEYEVPLLDEHGKPAEVKQ